jgi:hypothetical protein
MITRRKLKELFKNIAESHKQINSFGWGDVPEILARQDHIYPLMMVTPSDVINEDGQVRHNYIISVADRLKKDISNQVDVDSDTQQIMVDLIAIFYNIDYLNLSVEIPLNITPFKNIDPQDVIGWYGTFSLIVDENYDYCAVPTDPIPFDPNPPSGCLPANYRVQYENGTLIQEGTIPSGGSVLVEVPNPSVCDDATYQVLDDDGNVLYSGSIPSGGSEQITILNSTVNVNKSDGSLISGVSVLAQGVTNYNVADSPITVRNSLNNVVDSGNVKATESGNFTAPDGDVAINGTAFDSVASGGTIDIPVVKSTGNDPVGSKQGVNWRIGDSTVNVNKSDGVLISARVVKAEETVGYNVADSAIRLEDSAATLISNTNVKATDPATITAPDGDITVNSVAFSSVVSNGTENVVVKDTDGTLVGSKVGTEWIVPKGGGGKTPQDIIDDYWAALTNPPSSATIALINDELEDIINGGIWDDSYIGLVIGGNAADHAQYVTHPDGLIKMGFIGSPTHNADGISLNGSTQWARTRILSSMLPYDDKEFSIYKRNQRLSSGTFETIIGSISGQPQTYIEMANTGDFFRYAVDSFRNNTSAMILSQTDKLLTVQRTGASAMALYQDTTLINSNTVATTYETDREFMVGSQANNGAIQNPGVVDFSYIRFGRALDSTQRAIHATAVQNIQTILARAV